MPRHPTILLIDKLSRPRHKKEPRRRGNSVVCATAGDVRCRLLPAEHAAAVSNALTLVQKAGLGGRQPSEVLPDQAV
jgi:hypothetical protein